MLGEHKLEVLRTVEASELPVREVLDQLEIPRSTYYRWRHHFRKRGLAGLRGRPPGSGRVWNQILPKERDRILEMALLFPEWSSREVSCQVTDRCGLRLGILGLPDLESGRADSGGSTPELSSRIGISNQDDPTQPAVANGCDLSSGQELGLVLSDLSTG